MKKILIPVHTGFEATELITTINVLKRNKVDYLMWSIEGLVQVQSSTEAFVTTSSIFPAEEEFDGIFFHGGPAVEAMVDYDEVIHLAKSYNEDGKTVAAICAAPKILAKAGVLEGKTFTAHESTGLEGNTLKDVEVADHLITGRDYTITQQFAEAVVQQFKK